MFHIMLQQKCRIKKFTAVFVLFFPIIVHSCTYKIFKRTKICEDEKEIWTVGYRNRSLEAVVEVENCNVGNVVENLLWCEGDPCRSIAFLWQENNIFRNVSSWMLVTNNTHLVTALGFYDVVEHSGQTLLFGIRNIASISPLLYVWNISTKNCPKDNGNAVAILDPRGSYAYGSRGYFSCPEGHILVDRASNRLATNINTVCGTCARWERSENMKCWRAPNVGVNLSFKNKVFTAGDQLTMEICNVIDYGKPNASVGLFRNNLALSTPLTLKPQHNNMTVDCKAQNQLTKLLNGGGKFSEHYTVEVEFGPTSYYDWTSCTSTAVESGFHIVTLHVSLSANPPVNKPSIFVNGKKQTVPLKSSNGSVGCCGVFAQNYEITLINVTKRNKVSVEFNQKIQKLTLVYNSIIGNCSDILNSNEAATTTEPIEAAKISETTIAVICSGVVIALILITGIITLYFKKRSVGGQGSSPPQDQPAATAITAVTEFGDSRQAECTGAGSSYEIPVAHEYATVKEQNSERAYQNMTGVSDPDSAYAL